jgi:hypothetical protein
MKVKILLVIVMILTTLTLSIQTYAEKYLEINLQGIQEAELELVNIIKEVEECLKKDMVIDKKILSERVENALGGLTVFEKGWAIGDIRKIIKENEEKVPEIRPLSANYIIKEMDKIENEMNEEFIKAMLN